MSVSYIPEWVKVCLWGKAGGRCLYDGCNHPLYRDDVTQAEFNSAYIAHIIADKADGSRGHATMSVALTRSVDGQQILLPIRHNISKQEVIDYCPSLADKVARSTATHTVAEIAREIAELIRS